MKHSKDEAKKQEIFRHVNTNELDCIQDYAKWLEALLHEPCSIWEADDGTLVLLEIKQLVSRVYGLKIEIYSNEHPPPHFHVKSPNVDASFAIENCELIKGKISPGDHKKIRFWYIASKKLLIEIWNTTRPGDCVVGEYNGV